MLALFFVLGAAIGGNPFSSHGFDDDVQANDSLPPSIVTDLPTFPIEVLYVVTKEYEFVEDGTSQKKIYKGNPIANYSKADYMELRLLDLYPKRAYRGVVSDTRRFYDSVNRVYGAYLNDNNPEISKIDGQRMVPPDEADALAAYVSEEKERETMQMTDGEVEALEIYNYLARKPGNASLEDIMGVKGSKNDTNTILNKAFAGFFCVVSVGNCSHLYYRMMLCKERAEQAAEEYYALGTSGEKGDAFRHVAVSMMLRRYLTEPLSYMIMDVGHERIANPNTHPCDTYMDLHNNRVGRSTRYWQFRNASDDKHDWRSWLLKIKEFVDNENNAAHMDWDRETEKTIVSRQRQKASRNKYIYYGTVEE